ncbi:hypothetical protein [Hoeflea sp.]|uniref:hypothetical protein n=1 Tax=Hoeflea sp. TaxID=1940281 RepID=UPI002B000D75|nr:hypothetical protein [Hoeflea sp.]
MPADAVNYSMSQGYHHCHHVQVSLSKWPLDCWLARLKHPLFELGVFLLKGADDEAIRGLLSKVY